MSDKLRNEIRSFIKKSPLISNDLTIFQIGKNIGDGGTSIVYEATIEGAKVIYAIKIFLEDISIKQSSAFRRFKQTYINICSIQNQGFVLPQIYFGVLEIPEKGRFPYSIMLKADSTLKQKYNKEKISFQMFKGIFNSLGLVIEDLHKSVIIHRDLKPENIFYLKNKIVIGDCDIASYDPETHIKLVKTVKDERLANYLFSAPEQSDPTIGEISYASDWFAFGQMLYWLIEKSTYRGISPINLSIEGVDIGIYNKVINKLLSRNPKDRFQSFKEITDYIAKEDLSRIEYQRIRSIHESLRLFDELIYKYTFEHGIARTCISETNNPDEISDACLFLQNNITVLDLSILQGNADWKIKSIERNESGNYVFGNLEISINKLSFFRLSSDLGGSLIIIHTNPLVPITKVSVGQTEEEICYYGNRIISRAENDTGWAIIDGVRTKLEKTLIVVRVLIETIYFICPKYGPKWDNFEKLEHIFKENTDNKLDSNEFLNKLKDLRRSKEASTYD